MSTRPFIAARIEEFFDRRIEGLMRSLGWREKVICYTGYGTSVQARVLGRVVLEPPWSRSSLGRATEELMRRRGFRNFVSVPCVRVNVEVEIEGVIHQVVSDRGGYLDHRIRNHGLEPGWRQVKVRTGESAVTVADLQIVADEVDFGIISDIDDTVITTWLPRPAIAAWNSFIRDESARQAIPGMARMYQALLADHPGSPVCYVSTGAWNTHGFLSRFLKRHAYPAGPMILTDWGPTNTGWFRSGLAHKAETLLLLSRDFPNIRWLLVGDDGQHDPMLYTNFSQVAPERVRAIAIRELTPTEQVLAHGTPTVIEEKITSTEVPYVAAPDGRGLLAALRNLPYFKSEPEGNQTS